MTDFADLPPGYAYVTVRTTHLEMLANTVPTAPDAPAGCEITRLVRPALDEYRTLFNAVGSEWGWSGRLRLTDDGLAAVLNDDRIEVWRLTYDGRTAGMAELDRRVPGEVEIVYFGVTPEFIGRGLGTFMLRHTIHRAWTTPAAGPGPASGPASRPRPASAPAPAPTKRLWLHTCDLDSPAAIPFYEKGGFRVFLEETGPEAYPAAHIARRNPG
jgi:GNAT superfamily N-acetyltransferase